MGLEFSLSLGWHARWDACREPGKRWSSLQSCLSASPWGQANICRLLMREVQASHSSPVTPKCPLTSQGGSNPTRPQDQSTRSVALTTHSPPVYSPFLTRLCFSTLTPLHMDLSYSLGCRGVFLPVSSYFSLRIVAHVGAVLMYPSGEVSSMSSYSAILIDLWINLTLFQSRSFCMNETWKHLSNSEWMDKSNYFTSACNKESLPTFKYPFSKLPKLQV